MNTKTLYAVQEISGSTTITIFDDCIFLDTSTQGFTITLPTTPKCGHSYIFKDISSNAGANNVIISGNGKNIDGTSSITLNTNNESARIIYDCNEWRRII